MTLTSTPDRAVIGRLPAHLIDQIAAGEVIERPASVVKELIENALDAAATRIDVAIDNAGSTQIRVVDNGAGMSRDDIALAVERHATSKIRTAEDLTAIGTFGFRGEALAAIASVSHLEIVSRRDGGDAGYLMFWEGGTLIEQRETGAPKGTAITVRHLFYNTPARREYMRTPSTETKRIIETVTDFACGAPEAGFALAVDGRDVLQLSPAGDVRQRMVDVFGTAVADGMIAFDAGDAELGVSGLAGRPELGRATRDRILLFVNGRRVWSQSLLHAATNAYGETLPHGRYPFALINVRVNPLKVDVNVHPTKREVRFARDRSVYDLIYYAINRVIFSSATTSPVMRLHTDAASVVNERLGLSATMTAQDRVSAGERGEALPDSSVFSQKTDPNGTVAEPSPVPERSHFVPEPAAYVPSDADGVSNVWQFNDVYIATVVGDELWIIDQHTAHERIQYEDILRRMNERQPQSQQLLFPETVQLEPTAWNLFEESLELFGSLGFQVRPFGSRTALLEGVPSGLRIKNPVTLFRRVLEDLEIARKAGEDLTKAAAASTACRSSVMAGDRLKKEEMQALFARLIHTQNPFSCPHGRPTMVKIPISDFDRKFCRK